MHDNKKIENDFYKIIYKIFNIDNYESYVIKMPDKNQFLKRLFKEYQNILKGIDDELLIFTGKYSINKELDKVISFISVKNELNYKEKIKMLKNISSLSFLDLIILEEKCKDLMFEVSIEIKSSNNEQEKESLEPKRKYIHINLSTITILKCALFDYHRLQLTGFDKDNNPITKPTVTKYIFSAYYCLYVFSKNEIDINVIFDKFCESIENITKKISKCKSKDEKAKCADDITYSIQASIIWYFQNYNSTEIDMLLFGDKYNETILNNNNLILMNKNINSACFRVTNLKKRDDYLRRKVLLPTSGVVILTKDDDVIESIYLKEKVVGNNNCILSITRYKTGAEVMNSVILGDFIDYSYRVKFFGDYSDENIFLSLVYIYDFYKIDDLPDEVYYDVISPVYWKYRDKGYTTENDVLSKDKNLILKREFEIDIAPFLRKINGTPSQEALTLARKLSIDLKDGYTIVKPHKRTYNKINNQIL